MLQAGVGGQYHLRVTGKCSTPCLWQADVASTTCMRQGHVASSARGRPLHKPSAGAVCIYIVWGGQRLFEVGKGSKQEL